MQQTSKEMASQPAQSDAAVALRMCACGRCVSAAGDDGAKEGPGNKVVSLQDYRGRPRRRRGHSQEGGGGGCPATPPGCDQLTRDMHAAASTMLKMVWLARHERGLPPLPMP